jgi:autotransporter-associated beta strand protein
MFARIDVKFLRVFAASLVLVIQVASPILAADFYWDSDGNAVGNQVDGTGLGGSGTWDSSSLLWWDSASDVAWSNTTPDRAIFTGPFVGGTPTSTNVTVGGSLSANALSFLRSGYTLTGGDITLGGSSPQLFAAFGETATINTQILGSSGLVKAGAGSIRLTNSLNSYTGTTSIQNGSLVINSAAALGGTGAVNISTTNTTPLNGNLIGFNGGSLVLDGTSSGFTFGRDINFEGRGPIGDRNAAILSLGSNTLSGTLNSAVSPLPPSPGLTRRPSRISSVNGTLTLSGSLNVSGAALTAGDNGGTTTNLLTLGTFNGSGVGNFNLTGSLTGGSTLEKVSAGTLFLNPSNTSGFTGAIRIGAGASGQQSSVRVTQATVGGTSVFGAGTGAEDAAAIDLNGGVLEFRSNSSLNFNALASGKNAYLRSGTSVVYSGPAAGGDAVNGTTTLGALRAAANANATFRSRNGFGTTLQGWSQETSNGGTVITNEAGGTLLFTGNAWNNNDTAAQTVINGSINSSGAGAKSLAKTGTGSLTIVGTGSTLSGPVSVEGSLVVTDFGSIGSNTSTASITLGNTTTSVGNLIIGTTGTPSATGLATNRPIIFNGTTATPSIYANQAGNNPVILNGAITRPNATTGGLVLGGTNTADNTINAGIPNAGTGGLLKTGSGTWVLAGSNGYTGATNIVNGTLKIQANAATSTVLAAANDITFNNSNVFAGGTFEFVGQAGVNNVQALDVLTTTSGAGTIKLTPGASGTASLSFASQTTGAGGTVNFVGADFLNNKITITGGNGLVGRTNYWNGSDFAYRQSNVLRAPVYGTDSGFSTSSTALTANANMQITDSFAANTITINTLKIAGSHTLTLNAGQTVTVNGGGVLATGGNAIITGGTSLALAGQALVVRTNLAGDSLDIQSVVTGTGGLTKGGAGTLILSGANDQTGTVAINEGTVRLSGSGRLGAASALTMRQGTVLDLNGVTPTTATNAYNNNGSVTSASSATFTVGGNDAGGNSFGTVDGAVNLTKIGTASQSWFGNSTYTGVTTIGSSGIVTVDTLANGGVASGIGASSSAASNLVFNTSTGGLLYAGNVRNGELILGNRSATTDRLFTLSGTGLTLQSNATNNNAIVWSNTGAIVHGFVGPQSLIFRGTSTGDNTFNPQLTDSGTGANITSVTKLDAGQWNLANSNNTYTGITTIGDGILALNNSGALPANSPLVLGAGATSGIIQTSGTFARDLSATVTPGSGTITWGGTTGGGGFAAHAGPLTVTLNGGASLAWGAGGFVGTNGIQSLILNSGSSLSDVTFTNDINLGNALRTVTVNDNPNTGAEFASLTGVLSGDGGLTKSGSGVLRLGNSNTYKGITSVTTNALVVSSLGNSANPGATSVGDSTSGNSNAGAVVLGSGTNGGFLVYVGNGETSDRKIRLDGTTANSVIYADGAGPLVLTNVAHDTMAIGDKTLLLRGTNTGTNMITSTLANNGAGVLSVTVDGGASWVLSGNNTYTGTTSTNAGALGLGSNNAIGTGTLNLNNGNIFAYGGDRTIGNAVTYAGNTNNGFFGDHSITFTGALTLLATTANINTTANNIAAGKALTFAGPITANAITSNRTWAIDGLGETRINGAFSTSTPFGVRFDIIGGGTLTLGNNDSSNNFNKSGLAADIDRGTLKFAVDNAIPTATATSGGVLLSPELVTGDIATLDLNGTTQTLTTLSSNSDGTSIITNTAAGAANLIVGAQNTNTSFGTGGAGTYAITQPAGVINLSKIGTGTANFSGTLGNTGSVTASGGTLNINSASIATAVAGDGGAVNFKGGFTNPGNLTSVVTNNGGLVSFANGAGTSFNNLASLSLSLTANSGLELDVGDTGIDKLTTSTAANVNNVTTLFVKDVDITSGGVYDLLVSASGGLGNSANYLLNLPGYSGSSLTVTGNLVQLNAGTLITSDVYWNNGTGQGGGTLTQAWNTVDSATNNINFSGAVDGLVALTTSNNLPGKGQKVIFQADNLSGGAPLATTLGQSFTVNALEFRPSATPANTSATISIAPGAVSSNSLTVKPSVATDGIRLQSGASGTVSISAPLVAAADQTWTVTDPSVELQGGVITGTNVVVASTAGLRPGMTVTGAGITAGTTIASIVDGTNFTLSAAATNVTSNILAAQQLNLSGPISGTGDIVKAGAGKVVLSGSNGNPVGTYTNSAGTTELSVVSALGGIAGTPGSGADVSVTGGSFYYNNAGSGTLANDITLGGGTLSAGGNNQTYSGNINVAVDSTVNARDQAGSLAFVGTTQRNITLSGVVSGSAGITVDSVATVTAGNQITGNFALNNAASTWNGPLSMTRGTALFTNVAGSGTATPYVAYDGVINFNQFGRVIYRNTNGMTFNRTAAVNVAASAVGEFNVDNVDTLTSNFVVNQQGAVNLKGGSILRITVDDGSRLNLNGGVVLDGDASITVQGSPDVDNLLTISGPGISGTGNLALNDEAGVWTVASRAIHINAASNFVGNSSLSEGTLILGNKNALNGTGTLSILGPSTIQASTDLSGANAVANPTILSGDLTVAGTNNLELSGQFTATGGNQNRTVTNAVTGTAALSISGPVNLGASTNTAARTWNINGSGNTTISGVVADGNAFANNLTKAGAGTLTLSNTNTYTGTTTVSSGLLVAGADNVIPDASAVIVGGAASASLNFGAFNDSIASLTLGANSGTAVSASQVTTTSGTLTLLGDVTTNASGNPTTAPLIAGNLNLGNAGSRTFTVADSSGSAADLLVTANISGAAGLTKSGAGVMAVSGNNTYTGATNVNTGILAAGSNNAFGTNSAVTVGSGGTLTVAGNNNSIGSLAGTGSVNNAGGVAATLTTGADNSTTLFSGIISNGSGGSALSVDKVGTGTMTVTGANTYTGTTTISAGSLMVNNTTGSGTGTGSVVVRNNAFLGGTGTIAGATQFEGGSTHGPGNSPGTQTFSSDLTYNSDGVSVTTVDWELVSNGTTISDFDKINVGGALSFANSTTLSLDFQSAGSTVDWSDSFWASDKIGTNGWLVYNGATSLNNLANLSVGGNLQDIQGDLLSSVHSAASFYTFQDGNNVYLNYVTAVPEPGTIGILGLAGLAFAAARRRKARKAKATQDALSEVESA